MQNSSEVLIYRRLMLQKAAELSQQHGGLKRIPAEVLQEHGIEVQRKGRTATISITIPSQGVMERRIAGMKAQSTPIAKEVQPFKLPSEPTPRSLSERTATMEDFWVEQGWYKIDRHGWRLTNASWSEGDAVRRKAVRFLVDKVLQKNPREMISPDFLSNRLCGLLNKYYSGSPYEAVAEAFPELDIKPWGMFKTSNVCFRKKRNRVAAVKWLVEEVRKDPRDLVTEDFSSNRLFGLLSHHYSDSPYEAVSEAYPELNFKPWEMSITPNAFYKKKSNRVAAVRWFVEESGKNPKELTFDDFRFSCLAGLLQKYYSNSPFEAVFEAGLVRLEDEQYMRKRS